MSGSESRENWSPASMPVSIAPFWVEGEGFRLGLDLGRSPFVGLVGTETWAIELTHAELVQFGQLAGQLAETMAGMAAEVMEGEQLSVELEAGDLWMEVEGYPREFCLRFILQSGRGVEGEWGTEGTRGLLGAIDRLRKQLAEG